jgi:hypothetical protein
MMPAGAKMVDRGIDDLVHVEPLDKIGVAGTFRGPEIPVGIPKVQRRLGHRSLSVKARI